MKIDGRKRRHRRVRKKVSGTQQRPRLCVFRSLNNLRAQIIDDVKGTTLVALSTDSKDIKAKAAKGGNVQAASILGEALAKKAVDKGVKEVVFDRAGYKFHGRVKALAEACRNNGLVFS